MSLCKSPKVCFVSISDEEKKLMLKRGYYKLKTSEQHCADEIIIEAKDGSTYVAIVGKTSHARLLL